MNDIFLIRLIENLGLALLLIVAFAMTVVVLLDMSAMTDIGLNSQRWECKEFSPSDGQCTNYVKKP